MARPLRDSEYIFGLHDPGGERIMLEAGRPGWILFTERVGSDPRDQTGRDYRPWSDQGLGVIVRLNHGYDPEGTIPVSDRYQDFARRCANFVRASKGCHIWIIGNEMNFVAERPSFRPGQASRSSRGAKRTKAGVLSSSRGRTDRFNVLRGGAELTRGIRSADKAREVITPQLYVRCYRLVREAIHDVPGHEKDQVLVGAIAPWNNQTRYEGNPEGDWIQYFRHILEALGPDNCDGFAIHTYTHGDDPGLVYSTARLDPPFHFYHYHFFAYRDFMTAVPANMRHLPVYITEADQDVAWRNENRGWVQRAYAEINWWNQQPGHQQIRALILYRWSRHDKWYIEGKQGVIEDFRQALRNEYKWKEAALLMELYKAAWLEGGGILKAVGGQTLKTHFKLRNDGSKTWRHDGPNPVHLGFHWRTGDGEPLLVPPDKDYRTPLPHDVAPGEIVVLPEVLVAVPEQAGALQLHWDLVEEGVTWFKDQGSPEKVETVTVTAPPPPDEIIVPETGKTVKGPFLNWYRAHGLEVTGYPITEQFVDSATGLPTQYFQRVAMEEYAPGQIRLRLIGQDVLRLQGQLKAANEAIARLQAQVAELEERLRLAQQGGAGGARISQPEILNVIDQLPRSSSGFHRRQVSDIRYLVINHTGGPANIPAEQLAGFHMQRGYPGLAYHYLITEDGNILQTNPWTDTVSDQGYLGVGLNVAFAGKFDEAIPNEAQLAAAAHLLAWLLQELGLTLEAIKGVSEFVAHGSPGWQWLHGQRYKDILLARVAAIQPQPVSGAPGSTAREQELQAEIARLQSQIADLTAQLQTKTSQLAQLQAQWDQIQTELDLRDARIGELEEKLAQTTAQLADGRKEIEHLKQEVQALQAALDQALANSAARRVPRPIIHDVVEQLVKHPSKKYDVRPRSRITNLCIHHSAVAANIPLEKIADYHVNSRGWPGIGYHFYVKPEGTIYQTNRIETISYHVAYNNDYTVGICVGGDFTYATPTAPQLDSAARLVAWLMQELNIPQERVMGHKEYPRNQTSCPGETWLKGKRWKDALFQKVQEVVAGTGSWAKTLYHYVLFWQKPGAWAREDWLAAEKYIERFRPTTGFSLDDARHAEYVTIVGGLAGISYEAEQMLRAAGCKVERLAGVDYADTKRILDELAASGRRFRDFPG